MRVGFTGYISKTNYILIDGEEKTEIHIEVDGNLSGEDEELRNSKSFGEFLDAIRKGHHYITKISIPQLQFGDED